MFTMTMLVTLAITLFTQSTGAILELVLHLLGLV